jgi:hypothetical protein
MSAEREAKREAARRASDQLFYELIHNLVIETTRMSIEVKNLKMRVESQASRLEFNERRARALESAVVYSTKDEPAVSRPSTSQPPAAPAAASAGASSRPLPPPPDAGPRVDQAQQGGADTPAGEGPGQRSRRRRRRRGRRGRGPAAAIMGAPTPGDSAAQVDNEPDNDDAPAHDDLETISGADSHPTEPPPDREPHEG